MKNYLDLLRTVVETGTYRDDRTGTGTYSIFGAQARFSLEPDFPLLTTKKLHLRSILAGARFPTAHYQEAAPALHHP